MNDQTQAPCPPDDEENLTPQQEATRLKLLATYQANLIYLQKEFPYVFDLLTKSEPSIPYLIQEDGGVIITDKGRVGSEAYFMEIGKLQYRFFCDPKQRVRVVTRFGYTVDERAAAPHANNPHFYHPTEPEFRFRMIRKFKELCPSMEDRSDSPNFGEDTVPIVISFGVGYGHDLELIVENQTIRHLVIAGHDIADFELSLYFVDYPRLHQLFKYRGGKYFTILMSKDLEELTYDLIMTIRGHWPPYFARGTALHYNDFKSEEVKTVSTRLSQGINQLFAGWGFFDDEILSLLHSAQNIERQIPLCMREVPKAVEKSIAFIVGSGPSLDHLWPLIEEHRERAVIFCCGSAVSAFMKKGVKPDFYIEIERTDFTYEFMSEPRLRAFVEDIPLLFLSVIPPGCFDYSKKPLMVLKQVDGGTQIIDIDNSYPRFSTGPTVTNCGTDFALRMGFSEIYLLGVDVGYLKDSDQHHSKFSYYYDETHPTETVSKVVQETDVAMKHTTLVPGNFVEEVESTLIFIQTRDIIAYSIKVHGDDKKVYNLNNGAAIKGAEPLAPENVRIDATPADKAAGLERIASCFGTDYPRDIRRNLEFLAEQMSAVHEDISGLFDRPLETRLDVTDLLADLNFYLFAKKHQGTAVFPMLRGSLYHLCNIFYDCLTQTKEDAVALEYAREGFACLLDFLLKGREVILQIADEAERRLTAQ